jgi:hypothetical protein
MPVATQHLRKAAFFCSGGYVKDFVSRGRQYIYADLRSGNQMNFAHTNPQGFNICVVLPAKSVIERQRYSNSGPFTHLEGGNSPKPLQPQDKLKANSPGPTESVQTHAIFCRYRSLAIRAGYCDAQKSRNPHMDFGYELGATLAEFAY